jgi:hypothetical protein
MILSHPATLAMRCLSSHAREPQPHAVNHSGIAAYLTEARGDS